MSFQFLRVSLCRPLLRVASTDYNTHHIISNIKHSQLNINPDIIVFPELALTGYTCEDLFHNDDLLDAVNTQILNICTETLDSRQLIIIGTPLRTTLGIYNCAIVLYRGKIICAVPKCSLPNYSEYYEKRFFDSGFNITDEGVKCNISTQEFLLTRHPLIYLSNNLGNRVALTIEICEDVWSPFPPSQIAISHGATVVINLSASNALASKEELRKSIISTYSYKNNICYIYCSAAKGEAVNDAVWDGHCIIANCGDITLDEVNLLPNESSVHTQDIDVGTPLRIKLKNKTNIETFSRIRQYFTPTQPPTFNILVAEQTSPLDIANLILPKKLLYRFPYLESNYPEVTPKLFKFIYNSQIHALHQRLIGSRTLKICLGVSGGLDSTHVLLVIDQLIKKFNLTSDTLIPVVLPSSVSSSDTQNDAIQLIEALGYIPRVVEINDSVELMLNKLGRIQPHLLQDITYENVQAGERTSYLFRLANQENAIVVGTSDLSELALGWCTYGVGDHMSHFGLNVGLPKTVVKACVSSYSIYVDTTPTINRILHRISSRKISPELKNESNLNTVQDTEYYLGPFPVIDFILYHFLHSQPPIHLLKQLAQTAFLDSDDLNIGHDDIEKAFSSFKSRFLKSQFKRTALPNGPKLFSCGSLSPRTDWRSPVDAALYENLN